MNLAVNKRNLLGLLISPIRQSRIGIYVSGLALIYSAAYILILFNAIQDQHQAMVAAGTGGLG